jgi:hypothetical protein
MKYKHLLSLLTMTLLLPWATFAQSESEQPPDMISEADGVECPTCKEAFKRPKSMISSSQDMFQKVVDYIPESDTKRGLNEYAEALGFENYGNSDMTVGAANVGMGMYFGNRYSDPKNTCVRNAVESFYGDIAAYMNKRNKDGIEQSGSWADPRTDYSPIYKAFPSDARAKLTENIGSGKYADYEPGWVWNLALKHAHGDPNSAMFLVGMCGHDDTMHGEYVYNDTSEKGKDTLKIKVDNLRDKIKKQQLKLELLKAKHSDSMKVQNEIDNTMGEINSNKGRLSTFLSQEGANFGLTCPPYSSAFFGAKSLGENVDIPSDLKSELISIFADDGAQNVSSKYYHVYGSAFMACQLIQNGYSATTTSIVQQQAARVYRGIRMCSATAREAEAFKQMQASEKELFKKYNSKDPVEIILKLSKDQKLVRECFNYQNTGAECILLLGYNAPLSAFLYPKEYNVTEKDIRKKIEGRMMQIDAAGLYEKWYFGGGEIAGRKMPCSDLRVLGPSNLRKPTESFFGRISKPSDWSDERYKEATKKLATWDADFKWTIAQHKAGAEFAGKVCKKRGPNEPPLKGLCPEGISTKSTGDQQSKPQKGTR